MWFDEPLDWSAVRALVRERVVGRFPSFSQRVVQSRTTVWWEDVPDFDIDDHLHHVTLDAPGDRAALERFASSLLSEPLRSDRPLWDMYFVDGYGETGCAVVSRIHHCVADGIALMRVMLSMTDDPHEAARAHVGAACVAASRAACSPRFAA